jgi:hypothetical protein
MPHSLLIKTPWTDNLGGFTVDRPVGLWTSSSSSCIKTSGTAAGSICAYRVNGQVVFGGSSVQEVSFLVFEPDG